MTAETFWPAYAAAAAAAVVLLLFANGLLRPRAWIGFAAVLLLASVTTLVGGLIAEQRRPADIVRAPAVPAAQQPVLLPANPVAQVLQPALPYVEGTRFEGPVPADLQPLPGAQVRNIALTLSARLGDLLSEYLTETSASRELTPEDATNRRVQLDTGLDRAYRTRFDDEVFRVGREMQRRMGIASEVLEVHPGKLVWGDIADVQHRLAAAAALLP
jgi:hypothetical protein